MPSGGYFVTNPVVTSLLKFDGQVLVARKNDLSFPHDVDLVRYDVFEQSLIMGDDKHSSFGPFHAVDSKGDLAQGIDVQPAVRFVEDAIAWLEHGHLKNLTPFLFTTGKPFVK